MAYDQFLVCQRIFIDFERSARTRCVVQGEICDTSTIPTPMSSEMRSVLGRIRADVVHEEVGARLHPQCVSQEERYMWYCVRTHTDVVRDGIGTLAESCLSGWLGWTSAKVIAFQSRLRARRQDC